MKHLSGLHSMSVIVTFFLLRIMALSIMIFSIMALNIIIENTTLTKMTKYNNAELNDTKY